MTVKELRDALFLVDDQKMSIADLRWMLFSVQDQEQELTAQAMRDIEIQAKKSAHASEKGITIEEKRHWSLGSVKGVCIRHDLYTSGTNADYEGMLDMVQSVDPIVEHVYTVARDIEDHSDDVPIEAIMHYLVNEACWSTFEIHS